MNAAQRKGMWLVWMFALWCLLGGVAGAAVDQGPLSVPIRFPLHLVFLSPRPVSARLPDQGTLGAELAIDYSSVYFDQRSRTYDFLMDMEMTVVDLTLAYGLMDRLGLRLNLPLVSMNAGVLDGFLKDYHDTLGVANYGREARPNDSFAYRMRQGGEPWVDGASGEFRLADITLSAQWGLFPTTTARHWQSSLMASVKAPTGDADTGYGSGRWDVGLFLPNQWSFARWTLHLMPGLMLHDDPETQGAEVTARESYSLFGGAAYAYNERWIWLAQLNYFTSPLEETGVARIDDGALELALGFRRVLNDNWRIEFAFCEDPLILAAPDFTVHLGLAWSSSK